MAIERFSKLQKWILINCKDKPVGMARRDIVNEYFRDKAYIPSQRKKAEVTVTRSIWSLIEKGYAEGTSPLPLEIMAFKYISEGKIQEEFGNDFKNILREPKRYQQVAIKSIRGLGKVKLVKLTDKGEKKAEELLNVKFQL